MFSTFDVISYLEDREIEYWTSGKNVKDGNIAITCPVSFCNDNSNHRGISLETKFSNCWKCGEVLSPIDLIMILDQCNYKKAESILKKYQEEEYYQKEGERIVSRKRISLPKECLNDIPESHKKYLIRRNFDPLYLTKRYDLKFITNLNKKYAFRIIIPFYLNSRLITFSTMSIADNSFQRYKHQSKSEAVIDCSRTLYNIDHCGTSCIIVEGVTDVWRIGDGAVGMMGVFFTKEQIQMLIDKGIKKVFVCYDADAKKEAKKLAHQISGIIDYVELIILKRDDPDKQDKKTIMELRRLLIE